MCRWASDTNLRVCTSRRRPSAQLVLDGTVEGCQAHVERARRLRISVVSQRDRILVDEQADGRSIRDRQDRLAGVAKPYALRVHDRPGLVEAVEQRGRVIRGLALLEGRPDPEEAVRQREQRLRLLDVVGVVVALHQPPLIGGVVLRRGEDPAGRGHQPVLAGPARWRRSVGAASSSLRSATTMSAPLAASSAAWPSRSTPITSPNAPARPASTPASASSTTIARAGATLSRWAASRNMSGAGLPGRPSSSAVSPSTHVSNRLAIPA